MSIGYEDKLDDLALLIDRMHEDYLNRALKRGGKDFLSGLIKAYQIMTGAPNVDTAFAAALEHARRITP